MGALLGDLVRGVAGVGGDTSSAGSETFSAVPPPP